MRSSCHLARLVPLACGLWALAAVPQVQAQPSSAPAAPTAAAQPPAPAASAQPAARARPEVVVIEDDGARIEETRSGGALKRVTVQSKVGNVRAYEIQVAPAGRDPSQERGNAGRRAWSLFSF